MFFKSFVAVATFSFSLFACTESISTLCQKKLLDSHAFQNQKISLKISKNRRLVYSDKQISHYIKYDKFLHLYLVDVKDNFKYPFLFVQKKPTSHIANTAKKVFPIKIEAKQIGLSYFAKADKPLPKYTVITENCCALEGIVTSRGIVDAAYLQHFMKTKKSDYADFGFRVKKSKKRVFVAKVNPFIKDNHFKEGDEILSMDSQKVSSPAHLMQRALFATIGSKHTFKVKRDNKIIQFTQKAEKRLAGGFVKETFLEQIGIYLDATYRLTQESWKYQLKKGDRILYINAKKIESDDDIYRAFHADEKNKFLIYRDGFSFTIKI